MCEEWIYCRDCGVHRVAHLQPCEVIEDGEDCGPRRLIRKRELDGTVHCTECPGGAATWILPPPRRRLRVNNQAARDADIEANNEGHIDDGIVWYGLLEMRGGLLYATRGQNEELVARIGRILGQRGQNPNNSPPSYQDATAHNLPIRTRTRPGIWVARNGGRQALHRHRHRRQNDQDLNDGNNATRHQQPRDQHEGQNTLRNAERLRNHIRDCEEHFARLQGITHHTPTRPRIRATNRRQDGDNRDPRPIPPEGGGQSGNDAGDDNSGNNNASGEANRGQRKPQQSNRQAEKRKWIERLGRMW